MIYHGDILLMLLGKPQSVLSSVFGFGAKGAREDIGGGGGPRRELPIVVGMAGIGQLI